MPDAAGNIKGISTGGKAGETIERIFGPKDPPPCWHDFCPNRPECQTCPAADDDVCLTNERECEWHPGVPATHEIHGAAACEDCWEKAYNLD